MEKTCDYSICTGCGVCSAVCPKKCISFFEGDLGHIYPRINVADCIDCKKCERACPALRDNGLREAVEAYAGIIRDKHDYLTTTSGGAAQAISKMTLSKGGVVYGCASLPATKVCHIRVSREEDLEKLKGSKYVQSSLLTEFGNIVTDVEAGRRVLFIGTPCQVAAVKALFNKTPENLLLVDIVCHGVPSLEFLKDYLRHNGIEPDSVGKIEFRDGKSYKIKVVDKSDKIVYESLSYYEHPLRDIYYTAFINGDSYRPSCYGCRFASPSRCSDITIGDFWGLGKVNPADEIPPHDKGISLLLPVTEKGIRTLDELGRLMALYRRDVDEAVGGNTQLRHPTPYGAWTGAFNCLRKIIGVWPAATIIYYIHRLKDSAVSQTLTITSWITKRRQ